ncbi:hypothetical protein M8007_21940 (plasmid) [Dinoroseobacter shibae]|jgi:hypothetical protein|uniref:hypothetical protein n=1 Tax=Dinoroseobacter shibae TaxID=215813 RepID=UPI0020218DC8|nr:hypothetical protein [Dinoroseobacter shibae]URF49223.1 hypothetical protein M8008_21920 [Dinoroseobacter shibae]URF53530.1 hypothetical protein M8007_21940 [Dinoroseobacter shibae]
MMRFARQALVMGLIWLTVAVLPVHADGVEQSLEGLHGIYVSKLCVTSGLQDGDAEIEMVFKNISAEMVFLDGVASDVSLGGELYSKDLVGSTSAQNEFGVDEGEVLDISSSHIGARMTDLKQDLAPGDHATVFLNFRHGTLGISAHVLPRGQC